MNLRKLVVGIAFLLLVSNVFGASKKNKNSKIEYVEMTLEEFNKTNYEELLQKKNIKVIDYFDALNSRNIYSIEPNSFFNVDWTTVKELYENCFYRLKTHIWEKELYTCAIKGTMLYDQLNKIYAFHINEIDNLRTMEEIEAGKNFMQERLNKIKELIPAKTDELKNSADITGAEIAKKYIYHGYEEKNRNAKLFLNGALEKGHAYYISGFEIDEYINSAGIISANRNKSIIVDYEPDSIKSKIVELSSTDVIIVGNKPFPIVIGVIGKVVDSKLTGYTFIQNHKLDHLSYETIEKYEKEFGIEVENE